MTIDQPIAFTGLVFGVVGFTYALIRDVMDGKRIDQLEKVTAGLRGDITEIIRDHRNNLAAVHDRIDSLHIPEPRESEEEREAPESAFPQVNLEEPATLPLTIVRAVPTDTAPGIAAVDAAVRQVFDDDAHTRGRHAHREGPYSPAVRTAQPGADA